MRRRRRRRRVRKQAPARSDSPDDAGEEQDAKRKRDPVDDEPRTAELVMSPPLDEGEKRQGRERDGRRAEQSVAKRALDDHEHQRPASRGAVLVGEMVTKAAMMHVSNTSAVRPTAGTSAFLLTKKNRTAPTAKRPAVIHASRSYPAG